MGSSFARRRVLPARTIALTAVYMLLALAGCRHYEHHARFTDVGRTEKPVEAATGTLNVHFLGTGGIYLQADGVSLLADPFFSNPRFWRTLIPVRTSSNTRRIDREIERLPGLDGLQAILVSHSHYDHALDLPYLSEKYHPPCIYGSKTLEHLLHAVKAAHVCALDDKVHDPTQGNVEWIEIDPRARIAAIRAQHFNHFMGIHYAKGDYIQPLEAPPSALSDWLEGDTYSFVIDILDPATRSPTFRVFYLPSAATHPVGTPPAALLDDGKRVDLAIIGAAQLEKDDNYPTDVLRRIQPAAVMLVHWDNFFDRYSPERPLMNFRIDPDEIARRITKGIDSGPKVYWPARGAEIRLLPLQR